MSYPSKLVFKRSISIDSGDSEDRKPPAVVLTPVSRFDDHHSLGSISTATTPHHAEENTKQNRMQRRNHETARTAESVNTTAFTSSETSFPRNSLITERSIVYSEMALLTGTVLISAATFIYVMVPTTALMALAMLLSALYVMGTSTVRRLVSMELERLRQTNGLRDLLPARVYHFLTEESLHDQLNGDSSLAHDYMYLLLYFLPLPRDQLYYYLNRLNPQHVEQLHQRGVGHVILGTEAMQVVMGEQGYAEATTLEQPTQCELLLTEEGAELETRPLEPLPVNDVADHESNAVVPHSNARDEEEEEGESDDSVVFNAIWDAFYLSIYAPASNWTTDFVANNILWPATSRILRYGTSLSFFSAIVAFGNVYRRNHGVWHLVRHDALNRRTERALFLTAAVSGASVVLALGVRYYFCAPIVAKKKKKRPKKGL